MNLYAMCTSPGAFEELVRRLFDCESQAQGPALTGFQATSSELRRDYGVDGFTRSGTVFQVYYANPASASPYGNTRRKVRDTCRKIAQHRTMVEAALGSVITGLVFVFVRDADTALLAYVNQQAAEHLPDVRTEV